jgi:hypothetical protein
MKEITRSRKSKNRQFNDKKKRKKFENSKSMIRSSKSKGTDNTTAKGKRIKYM